jgi:hypothetical protein
MTLQGEKRLCRTYCRYSSFEQLRNLLAGTLPQGAVGLPALPRKTLNFHGGVGDRAFVERRRTELQEFLQALLAPTDAGGITAVAPARKMWGE